MRDYAELVKALRQCGSRQDCEICPAKQFQDENCVDYIMTKAADAIEELLHKLCDWCGCCLTVNPDPYHCEIIGKDLSCQEPPKEGDE